jgi:hypothetical protein
MVENNNLSASNAAELPPGEWDVLTTDPVNGGERVIAHTGTEFAIVEGDMDGGPIEVVDSGSEIVTTAEYDTEYVATLIDEQFESLDDDGRQTVIDWYESLVEDAVAQDVAASEDNSYSVRFTDSTAFVEALPQHDVAAELATLLDDSALATAIAPTVNEWRTGASESQDGSETDRLYAASVGLVN